MTLPYGLPANAHPDTDLRPDGPDFAAIQAEATPRLTAGERDFTLNADGLDLHFHACQLVARDGEPHIPIFDRPANADIGHYVTMTRADGKTHRFDVSRWDWDRLEAEIDDFMDSWAVDVSAVRHWSQSMAKKIRQIQADLAAAKMERDRAVRAAHAAGLTNYRIAKDAGLSQTAVANILKA